MVLRGLKYFAKCILDTISTGFLVYCAAHSATTANCEMKRYTKDYHYFMLIQIISHDPSLVTIIYCVEKAYGNYFVQFLFKTAIFNVC